MGRIFSILITDELSDYLSALFIKYLRRLLLFGPQTMIIEKGKIIVVLLGRSTGQNQIFDSMEFDKDTQEKCSHTCKPGRYLSLCFLQYTVLTKPLISNGTSRLHALLRDVEARVKRLL